jgi:hypothetical protein
MFYGNAVSMSFMDNRQHQRPHIHGRYQEDKVVVSIPEGEVRDGHIPDSGMKLLQAWVELHKTESMENWSLAVSGQHPRQIDPLR